MSPAEVLQSIFKDCLFNDQNEGEVEISKGNGICAISILGFTVCFRSSKIEENKARIAELIAEVVRDDLYDGAAFSELCKDREGKEWGINRNKHQDADQLFLLAQAIGFAKFAAASKMYDNRWETRIVFDKERLAS